MTPTKTRPHKPMLAEWTGGILSLSLCGFWNDCNMPNTVLAALVQGHEGSVVRPVTRG